MSQAPGSSSQPPAGGGLPRVQPISIIGIFLCCVGYIWTVICYMQMCTGMNKIDPTANLQGWTLFVPIYSNLYFSQIIQAMNKVSQARGLSMPPLQDNIVLNFLLPLLPLYQMMQRYNEIADAVEGKRA